MTYLVLAGGLSHERDVSLRSGRRVADALRARGASVDVRDADAGLLAALTGYDAAFIALHGGAGEDGALREVLDLMGVPYAGSAPSACRLAWDKPTAKTVLATAGVPTPPSVTLPHAAFRELGAVAVLDRIVARLGLPLMVKPAKGGSALGTAVVRSAADLPAAMVACFSYGDAALVESFVTGTELAVSVLDTGAGPVALPPVEIVALSGVFDYAARYTAGATEYFAPARLGAPELAAASAAAVAAHTALGLRDLSRADMIVDAGGAVHVLEVNVSPGMTETSMLPMAVAAAGLDTGELLLDLLARATARGSG